MPTSSSPWPNVVEAQRPVPLGGVSPLAASGPTALPGLGPAYPDTAYPQVALHEPVAANVSPQSSAWISNDPTGPVFLDPELLPPDQEVYLAQPASSFWRWQLLPEGLMYRSYLAGPREPRISTVFFESRDGRTLWDPTLGGRMALIRFGNDNSVQPEGWEVDVEGAAMVRLNLDANRDLDASDFRFGFPITYGVGRWQYKFGYYHLSSHLGDEFQARTPGAMRINYVRDAIIVGAAFRPVPMVRLYGETAYAFFIAGGAQPWEFQFGVEIVEPGPTGPWGVPFFAVNAHLREEINFGGDLTVQTGWLWRGNTGRVFRLGAHYMNGKSTQYQFFRDSEQQIGLGIWYDF